MGKFNLTRLNRYLANGSVPTVSTDAQTITGDLTLGGSTILSVNEGTINATGGAGGTELPYGKTVYVVNSNNDSKGVQINSADAIIGNTIYIVNTDSNNTCRVYPNSGATIDGSGGHYNLGAGKAMVVGYYATDKWFIVSSQN